MRERCFSCESYEEALCTIGEYVNFVSEDDILSEDQEIDSPEIGLT
jgi:hypothetical protein